MSKENFYITETQTRNCMRKGYYVGCGSLTEAKKHATREQTFHGTVLTIHEVLPGSVDESAFHLAIASKDDGGKWITAEGY